MEVFTIILLLIIILCLLGIMYATVYNKYGDFKIRIDEAEVIIDEALRGKYDTLIKISDKLKDILKPDKNYFKEYASLNEKNLSNFDMDRKLTEGFNLLLKMIDDNKIEDEDILKLVDEVKRLDEKLVAAKNYYNKYTSQMNKLLRKFPTNIIGKIHGYKVKLFFDGKDMDDEIIDDFKI